MHTRWYAIFVSGLAQSGVGNSRKCCFPVKIPTWMMTHRYAIILWLVCVLQKHRRILTLPNEWFGRMNKRWNPDFEGSTFQGREFSIWTTNHWIFNQKIRISSFVHPSQIFVWGIRRQLVPFFSTISILNISTKVNHESRLKFLSKCSKWWLSKKRGLVADGWFGEHKFSSLNLTRLAHAPL